MMGAKTLQPSASLRWTTGLFLGFWCLIAAFPLFWIAVMSFKLPVDAFAANPFAVIFGPATRATGQGLSVLDLVLGAATLVALYLVAARRLGRWVEKAAPDAWLPLGWLVGGVLYGVAAMAVLALLLPAVLGGLEALLAPIPVLGLLAQPVLGLTLEHYRNVWVDQEFYRNFLNSLLVTGGVVTISLTVGTLAGYALARTRSSLAFWLLISALIFRALPHSVLVSGYLPPFINSAEILEPILGDNAPTLYGQPLAVILVLVAINQPFTIWMLRSFFMNIPAELDEAARVDGCSHFEAFWRVIMPVMWPGVITTGLFSFLLAYNDFLVTSLLLDAQNQTMVPAIAGFFNRETTTTDQVRAVAAAVSITAPLFLLVMVFQRQIVSGLTAGAVKG
ncbi:carbohydrate ABC transporter permease [Salinarimonas sp.]|uniref:carbohydrate ABC transporter permease n=1 Tax=Salinarimonas sp. TaxID=2766526 RepID=UPI0032D93358